MTNFPTKYKYKKTVWTLMSCSLVLFASYLGLVGMTVSNTFDRQQTEKEIDRLTAKVGELEFSYLGAKSAISMDTARGLGFVDAESTFIAKRGGGDAKISMKPSQN